MSRSWAASLAWPSTTCVSARRKKSRFLPAIAARITTIGGSMSTTGTDQAGANHRRLRRRADPALFHVGARQSLVRGLYLHLLPRHRSGFLDALSFLAGDHGRRRPDRAILASDRSVCFSPPRCSGLLQSGGGIWRSTTTIAFGSTAFSSIFKNDDDKLPPVGRFNWGQKLFFWGMIYSIILLLLSGVVPCGSPNPFPGAGTFCVTSPFSFMPVWP